MTQPGKSPALLYEEHATARRWPLMVAGLFTPVGAIALCIVLGATLNPLWFLGVLFIPMSLPVLVYSSLLYRNWPTGIRIDDEGITIGAVGSRSGGREAPTIAFQSWGVFQCPWTAVRAVRVVTQPEELHRLKESPLYATLNNRWAGRKQRRHAMLGVLTPPFARAVLVIDVDPEEVQSPQVRPSRYYSNGSGGRMSVRVVPEAGATWIVPTRHPDQLAEALTQRRSDPYSTSPDST